MQNVQQMIHSRWQGVMTGYEYLLQSVLHTCRPGEIAEIINVVLNTHMSSIEHKAGSFQRNPVYLASLWMKSLYRLQDRVPIPEGTLSERTELTPGTRVVTSVEGHALEDG